MHQPIITRSFDELSAQLKGAISSWRERHDVPAVEGKVDATWHLSQHGHCDDFAQALSQQLSKLGIAHKLCVMSRVTRDEDGQAVDTNPFSHALVSIPCDGGEINVDSMGPRADLAFIDAWQDEPGQTTEFDYRDFASVDAMRQYLRTPIDGHGTPRSNPDNDRLVAIWSDSLSDALCEAGIAPVPSVSVAAGDFDDELDMPSDHSLKVYISLYGTATDPDDEDLAEWYCVEVSLAKAIEPTANLSPELIHCIYERAMDAFHGNIAIAALDDFEITAHLDDGRVLEALEQDPDDMSVKSAEMPWDLVLDSGGDVYPLTIEEVPVEVDFAATLGDDEPGYRLDLVREYPGLSMPGAWGYSPLHQAASVGEYGVVEALVELGADVASLDHQGMTPLHHAVTAADAVLMTKTLLDLGSDINQRDAQGKTACDHGLTAFNGRTGALWLKTQGASNGIDGYIYIDPAIDDLMELSESENKIPLKEMTPKVAAVLGGFIPELIDLMAREPQPSFEIDAADSLRRIAKKAGKTDVLAALDAQRSFESIRAIAASATAHKNRP